MDYYYTFVQTEAGRALQAMKEMVKETDVQAAVAVTGPYPVIVRIRVSGEDILDRLERIGKAPGVCCGVKLYPVVAMSKDIPPIPFLRGEGETTTSSKKAIVTAKFRPGSIRVLDEALRALEVKFAFVLGDVDALIQVEAEDLNAVARYVAESIHSLPGIESTATHVVLAEARASADSS